MIALAALTGSYEPTAAQWEVTPGIGFYVPLGSVVSVPSSDDGAGLDMRHVPAVAFVARVGHRLGPGRLEASAEFTPSLVAVRDPDGTRDLRSALLLSSLRFLVPVAGRDARRGWSVHTGGGAGLLRRWGEAWSGFSGTTDVALAASVIAAFAPRGSPLSVRLDLTNYVYDAGFRGEGERTLGNGLRTELVWTFGVGFTLEGSDDE